MTNNVKLARAARNFTQEDLAKAVGVSRQTIHAIEKRKYVPSAVLVLKIARLFDMRVEQLFALEDGD